VVTLNLHSFNNENRRTVAFLKLQHEEGLIINYPSFLLWACMGRTIQIRAIVLKRYKYH
jgi:hypothetical protein